MTILFPGRKLSPTDYELSSFNTKFRDDLVRCIASRVDKRHIVYDYAVSPDNIVFVPTQDESQWLNELDWSGFVTLKLYTPDFVHEGMTTNNAILQTVWQMHQDGSLKAVEQTANKPTKQRLPIAVTSQTKFGLVVEEAEDVVVRSPSTTVRKNSGPRFPLYNPPGERQDFGRIAREQYLSHSRRVASEPMIPPIQFDPRSVPPPPPLPPRPLAPFEPVYRPPPPPPLISQPSDFDVGGGGYGPGYPVSDRPLWDYQDEVDPTLLRPTVLRRRSSSRRVSGMSDSGRSESRRMEDRRSEPPRRKLSRSRGSKGSNAWPPLPAPPYPPRYDAEDMGCGCIIC